MSISARERESGDPRRALPSVGVLLDSPELAPLLSRAPRALVADAVRSAIDAAREDPSAAPVDAVAWARAVDLQLTKREQPSLRAVINATGVVLHTNLGRAPLAAVALQAIVDTAAGACNLEYDVAKGERGSRYVHAVSLLRELTGAEDAIVVNNCASALVLALNSVAAGREAIVSRGELIEIGGSFRVPDIMAKSGALLVEVGTTNRTHLADYRDAVHRSRRARSSRCIAATSSCAGSSPKPRFPSSRRLRERRQCPCCSTSVAGCSFRSTRMACQVSRLRATPCETAQRSCS